MGIISQKQRACCALIRCSMRQQTGTGINGVNALYCGVGFDARSNPAQYYPLRRRYRARPRPNPRAYQPLAGIWKILVAPSSGSPACWRSLR